jgi:hypothetical protein
MFTISSSGLKPINTNINLQEGMSLYIGYSSDPDNVIINKIDDVFIYYYRYPFIKEQREQINIFKDLAIKGTTKAIENNKQYLKSAYTGIEYYKNKINDLENILNGKEFKYHDFKNYQPYNFTITKKSGNFEITCPRKGILTKDCYYLLEQYFNQISFEEYFIKYTANGTQKAINEFMSLYSNDFIISDLKLDTYEY